MSKKIQTSEPANHIAVFQEKTIRRTWHGSEWWFAIVDVVAVLTDSVQPEGYVKDLRRRDKELAKGWGEIATPLRVETEGGVQRVNCANTEGLFRIIQSIPSPKAEPFKRWLAQAGYERVKEPEAKTGAPVLSKANYLAPPAKAGALNPASAATRPSVPKFQRARTTPRTSVISVDGALSMYGEALCALPTCRSI